MLASLLFGLVAAVPTPAINPGKRIQCAKGYAPYTYGSLGMYGTFCDVDNGPTLPANAISQCPPDFNLILRNGVKQCEISTTWPETTQCRAGTNPSVGGVAGLWETHCVRLDGTLVLPAEVNCPPKFDIETVTIDGELTNLCHIRPRKSKPGVSGTKTSADTDV